MTETRFSPTQDGVAVRSIHAMATGERAEFDEFYTPDAIDRENVVQPPSSRVPGPAGFWSTAQWLRTAFADLRYEIHHVIADGDLVAVNSTMSGTHLLPIAFYTPDGRLDAVFPPTGRPFAMAQSHWFRVRDNRIAEHWATRDDLGTAKQLGWIPPTPAYLVKMARAKRQAARRDTGTGRSSPTAVGSP
ncbi:ester cyclase [Amycolatopsis sp. NPDC003865]